MDYFDPIKGSALYRLSYFADNDIDKMTKYSLSTLEARNRPKIKSRRR